MLFFFFFKQKTAYEMRISDWSSDVCSSDLGGHCRRSQHENVQRIPQAIPAPHCYSWMNHTEGENVGTEISLSLAGTDLAWSKNHRGMDHGPLFQEQDRKPVRCDQIDYQQSDEEGIDTRPYEMAFATKLGDMLPRLELLGYTLALARASYEKRVETWREERAAMDDDGAPAAPAPLSFEEYLALATRYSLVELDDSFVGSNSKKAKRRFKGEKGIFARLPLAWDFDESAYSERSYFASEIGRAHV